MGLLVPLSDAVAICMATPESLLTLANASGRTAIPGDPACTEYGEEGTSGSELQLSQSYTRGEIHIDS